MNLSSIFSGGDTHIRYGHFHYPRVVQIICPYCSTPSKLVHTSTSESVEHFMDYGQPLKHWTFSCNGCLKRELKTWDETKDLSLLNKIEIRGEMIWAWNANHLEYLIGLLSGHEIKTHKWSFFKAYLHKNWLTKTKNLSDIRKLEKLMEVNKIYM